MASLLSLVASGASLLFFVTSSGPAIRPVLKPPGNVVLSATITRGDAAEIDPPQPDEVLKAVGLRGAADVRVTLEKRAEYTDPPRFYPAIGQAQFHHASYECTIVTAGGTRRIFVSQSHLHVLEK